MISHGRRGRLGGWASSTLAVIADPSSEEPAGEQSAPAQRVDLADKAERALTPRTPALALAGVWLVGPAVVALILLAVGLTLYFV